MSQPDLIRQIKKIDNKVLSCFQKAVDFALVLKRIIIDSNFLKTQQTGFKASRMCALFPELV